MKFYPRMHSSTRVAKVNYLRSQAVQHIRANRLDAAQTTLEDLIREAPQDIPACLELAELMYNKGLVRESSRPLLIASQHLPKHAPLLLHLIEHLIVRGEIVAARKCLDFLSQAPEPPTELLLALAHLRFSLGEVVSAKQLMELALKQGADGPSDHHMYAMLLQFTGDIEGACTVLEKCLSRWPDFGDAIVPLVGMRKQTPDHNLLQSVEVQLENFPSSNTDPVQKFMRAEFEYARFSVLDKLKQHEEAWSSLARSNALMHELNPYETENEAALVDAFINTGGLTTDADAATSGFEGPTPIFIVGMPRSGTTLLDRMLSAHSQVTSAGELIEFWRQLHWVADEKPAKTHSMRRIIKRHADINFHEVGARYLEQTQWRAQGHRFYIDKLPANIQMVAFIRRALPHAPILHMVRDPMDVCFSNLKAFFGNDTSAYSYDMKALAHYYRGYTRLCDHWRQQLPGAMLDVPYASLTGNPQSTMQKVLDFCGLDAEEACLHPERNASPVATPSSAQVREAIHTRSHGEWRKYAQQLDPLRIALS